MFASPLPPPFPPPPPPPPGTGTVPWPPVVTPFPPFLGAGLNASVIGVVCGSMLPASGIWLATTSVLPGGGVGGARENPAFEMSSFASSSVFPLTSGTSALPLDVAITTATAEPSSASSSGLGLWARIVLGFALSFAFLGLVAQCETGVGERLLGRDHLQPGQVGNGRRPRPQEVRGDRGDEQQRKEQQRPGGIQGF